MLARLAVVLMLFGCVFASKVSFQNCSLQTPQLPISNVTMDPFPAILGQPVVVNVTGLLNAPVSSGLAAWTIEFQGVPVYNKTRDLCQSKWFTCPQQPGPILLQFKMNMAKFLPQGDYQITVNMSQSNGAPITCFSFLLPLLAHVQESSVENSDVSSAGLLEQLQANAEIDPFDITAVKDTAPADRTSIAINEDNAAPSEEAASETTAAADAGQSPESSSTTSESPAPDVAESSSSPSAESPVPPSESSPSENPEPTASETTAASETAQPAVEGAAEGAGGSEATAESAALTEATVESSSVESSSVNSEPSLSPIAGENSATEEAEVSSASPSTMPAAELSDESSEIKAKTRTQVAALSAKHQKRTAQLMKEAKLLEEEFETIAADMDKTAQEMDSQSHAIDREHPEVTIVTSENAEQEGILPALPMLLKQVQEALSKGGSYLLPSSPANTITIPIRASTVDPPPSATGPQGPWPWTQDWELGDVEWTALNKEADDSRKKLSEINKRYMDEPSMTSPISEVTHDAPLPPSNPFTFPFAFVHHDSPGDTENDRDNMYMPTIVSVLANPQNHDVTPQQDEAVFPVISGSDDNLRDYFSKAYGQLSHFLPLPTNTPSHDQFGEPSFQPDDNPRGLAFPFPPSFRFVN